MRHIAVCSASSYDAIELELRTETSAKPTILSILTYTLLEE